MTPDARNDLDEYLKSLTRDVYLIDDFIPWAEIDRRTKTLHAGIAALQTLVDAERVDADGLAEALQAEPRIFDVLKEILAAPSGVGFSDRRTIPDFVPPDPRHVARVAALLVDLRLPDLLPAGSKISDLLRVALVGRDSRRRGFRRRRSLEQQTNKLFEDAVAGASNRVGEELTLVSPSRLPATKGMPLQNVRYLVVARSTRRRHRYAVRGAVRGSPDAERCGAGGYATRADAIPASLIAVADGQGLRDSPCALGEDAARRKPRSDQRIRENRAAICGSFLIISTHVVIEDSCRRTARGALTVASSGPCTGGPVRTSGPVGMRAH
ncbi:MAG TPA: hypothetical protein VKG82_02805 [Solirubrobacteraceae bacterium]|nr:hypothetical protein [Solirubrobacteraceae bacterium]